VEVVEFTFEAGISEEMATRLTWLYNRRHEVGIPLIGYVTAKPGVDLSLSRQATEGNLACYRFDVEDDACNVTMGCGCNHPDAYGINGRIKCNRCELYIWTG